ncbi:type IV toxin-antitoxin system AbiEi family antitoxin domain-containing protein [Geodermatophilus sp. CPCC 206100]|uniref:type IV toxin-antitoxin system AbiEi family antitoxin domain-containing protein n=1 Tax=Geodermatophilus sp. CPCC 206100 TaxID=3020054 RepID=UPI003B008CF1
MSDREPWPELLRRGDALAGGLSDGELARMVRRGELERLQRGAYLAPGAVAERRRLVITATVAGLRRPGFVSHGSAAVLHGLPLWGVALPRVHLVRRPPAAGSGSARVHLHVAEVPDDQVVLVDGLLVTDATRTVVDLARTVPFEPAVVTADAALAAGVTTGPVLRACLAGMGPVPGARRAARVLDFADARSGSVGESRSRVLIRRLGLPVPDLQVPVRRADGGLIGRSDFGWHEQRSLAEFDGRVKYGRLLRPGQEPGDAVFEEKLREDEMRDAGWQMARWTWGDLDRPAVVGARLRRAFARGARAA